MDAISASHDFVHQPRASTKVIQGALDQVPVQAVRDQPRRMRAGYLLLQR
jgi:hypothetical protein